MLDSKKLHSIIFNLSSTPHTPYSIDAFLSYRVYTDQEALEKSVKYIINQASRAPESLQTFTSVCTRQVIQEKSENGTNMFREMLREGCKQAIESPVYAKAIGRSRKFVFEGAYACNEVLNYVKLTRKQQLCLMNLMSFIIELYKKHLLDLEAIEACFDALKEKLNNLDNRVHLIYLIRLVELLVCATFNLQPCITTIHHFEDYLHTIPRVIDLIDFYKHQTSGRIQPLIESMFTLYANHRSYVHQGSFEDQKRLSNLETKAKAQRPANASTLPLYNLANQRPLPAQTTSRPPKRLLQIVDPKSHETIVNSQEMDPDSYNALATAFRHELILENPPFMGNNVFLDVIRQTPNPTSNDDLLLKWFDSDAEDENECQICMVNENNVVFDCQGRHQACRDCAKKICNLPKEKKKCPFCRQDVTAVQST